MIYSRLQLTLKYCQYYLSASNGKGHGIHSPFIFHFITKVLNDKTNYSAYQNVEALREQLLTDKSSIQVKDLGAGSSVDKTSDRTVSQIAKNSAKPKKYAQLLYRIAKTYQPQIIVELGTSLGLTTAY